MRIQDLLSNIKLVVQDPSRIASGLNRLYHRKLYTVDFNHEGANIFDEEWDNLIILDACRFDSFVRYCDLPGKTDYRYSRGSMSEEFIRGNFRDIQRYDTVYVSANYFYELLQDELSSELFRFISVERDAFDGVTSKPSTVTDRAIDAFNQHPNKKFIIHYLQPHQPYLGETGDLINHKSGLYNTAKESDFTTDVFRQAYHENLEIVLEEINRMLDEISGRTVISADHGEVIGHKMWPIPFRDFGHPPGIYVDDLVKVPWHVYENGSRDIKEEDGPYADQDQQDLAEIESHLSDLGYK
jgi:hypothetical protein